MPFGNRLLVTTLTCLVIGWSPASAFAGDISAFLQGGWPGGRSGTGLAFAMPIITEVFAVEGEYASSGSSFDAAGFRAFTGSVRLSLPDDIARFRPYVALGFGLYRQSRSSLGETSIVSLQGGGTFIRLLGPLAARVDVRFFQLRNAPFSSRQRRLYVGASFRF